MRCVHAETSCLASESSTRWSSSSAIRLSLIDLACGFPPPQIFVATRTLTAPVASYHHVAFSARSMAATVSLAALARLSLAPRRRRAASSCSALWARMNSRAIEESI